MEDVMTAGMAKPAQPLYSQVESKRDISNASGYFIEEMNPYSGFCHTRIGISPERVFPIPVGAQFVSLSHPPDSSNESYHIRVSKRSFNYRFYLFTHNHVFPIA